MDTYGIFKTAHVSASLLHLIVSNYPCTTIGRVMHVQIRFLQPTRLTLVPTSHSSPTCTSSCARLSRKRLKSIWLSTCQWRNLAALAESSQLSFCALIPSKQRCTTLSCFNASTSTACGTSQEMYVLQFVQQLLLYFDIFILLVPFSIWHHRLGSVKRIASNGSHTSGKTSVIMNLEPFIDAPNPTVPYPSPLRAVKIWDCNLAPKITCSKKTKKMICIGQKYILHCTRQDL